LSLIEGFVKTIERKSANCRGEEELRYLFLTELEILSRKLSLPFQPRIEETIQLGRADARVGAIIYEFKKPYRLDDLPARKEALEEIQRYLESIRTERQIPAPKLQGFVTDGKSAAFIAFNQETRNFVTVDTYERTVKEENAFIPISKAVIWLERTLGSLSHRELSPENLLEDFGPNSTAGRELIKDLWNEFNCATNLTASQTFYEQWKVLFSTATQRISPGKDFSRNFEYYGLDKNELLKNSNKPRDSLEEARIFLFVVHTYYSLILKLLAVRIADELQLLGPTSLIDLIESDPKEGLRQSEESLPRLLANFIERDVFSWFMDSKNPLSVISHMARRLRDYDLEGVRRDVLKRVYQTMIPQNLRKSLGEFYTKDWVAELLLDEVGYDGSSSLLDPACGSGTFLALAIKRKKASQHFEDPKEALEDILNNIIGFDINPIAVITARINYLLSILDILKQTRLTKGVSIPVYLCDSVRVPTERPDISAVQGSVGQSYVIPTAVGEIRLPVLADSHQELSVLRTLKDFSSRSVDEFLKVIRDKIGEDQELLYRPLLRGLHNKIVDLEKQGRDGVWAGLVENFFAPLLVKQCQFVVGNPPWVAPIHVPKEYRDDVRRLISNSGFQKPYLPRFKIAKARFPGAEEQYVACLPFVHLALNRYLKPSGKCAFLLTSSLIRLLHSGGFRQKMLDVQLDKIVDMTLITDIHEGATCWSFIPVITNKTSPRTDEVSYKFIWQHKTKEKRKKAHPEDTPTLFERSWKTTKSQLPFDLDDARSPWFVAEPSAVKIFRQMQEIYPRLGDICRINRGVMTSAREYYALRNVRLVDDFVIGENLAGEKVVVEKDLVYPVCIGEQVRAWRFDYTHLIIPHKPADWKPIPEDIMERNYPEAYDYFRNRRGKLESRTDFSESKGPFYMVFRISKEKAASWRVAYAYTGTQLEACVIPEKINSSLLKVEKELLVENTVYFVASKSENEALFFAGLLNSLPIKAFIQIFAKPKGFPYFGYYQWNLGILPFPRFDKSNALHLEIVEVSRSAHKGVLNNDELDKSVSKLYRITAKELECLQDTFSMLSGSLNSPNEQIADQN
jgi:hypothetical protein